MTRRSATLSRASRLIRFNSQTDGRRDDDVVIRLHPLANENPVDLCGYADCHCTPGTRPFKGGRVLLWALGWGAAGLAVLGLLLPLLPATPFALMSAWAFARCSPRLQRRLRSHPRLGPLLEGWRQRRAIPRRAKRLALSSLIVSWLCLAALGRSIAVLLGAGLLMVAVGAWIFTRNE